MSNHAPHWHEHNPWNDRLFYVTLEELADCAYVVGREVTRFDGSKVTYTKADVLTSWRQYGDKLDAYVLTGPTITGGVRFGPNGEDYISPGISLPALHELIMNQKKKRRKTA